MTWDCPNCGREYPDSALGVPRDADAAEKIGCLVCGGREVPVFFDPDDIGSAEVQDNGMLYVGRTHAGETVHWLIERQDGDD